MHFKLRSSYRDLPKAKEKNYNFAHANLKKQHPTGEIFINLKHVYVT
jgi:hypothetical protein